MDDSRSNDAYAPGGSESPTERDRLDGLIPVVYEELRGLAGLLLSGKAAHLTLQPTSLVHEVYLRLLDQRRVDWQDRLHFLRIAAKVMRRVLVDQCRARVAKKRAGIRVALEDEAGLATAAPEEADILTIDRLLDDLQAHDPQQARIIELRFFAGLTVEETAAALAISKATVKRDWAVAKAWLTLEMGREMGRERQADGS
jgi:RNA polymerase sigma-70 factor (ECF subfamily)